MRLLHQVVTAAVMAVAMTVQNFTATLERKIITTGQHGSQQNQKCHFLHCVVFFLSFKHWYGPPRGGRNVCLAEGDCQAEDPLKRVIMPRISLHSIRATRLIYFAQFIKSISINFKSIFSNEKSTQLFGILLGWNYNFRTMKTSMVI
jgi:hypothetical protein